MSRGIVAYYKRKKHLLKLSECSAGERDILNIHRFNTNNVGDLAAAPYKYFPQLGTKKVDILAHKEGVDFGDWINELAQHHMIVGGGGFFERTTFKQSINTFLDLSDKGRKVVFWGVGHNDPRIKKHSNYQKGYSFKTDGLDVFGSRDGNNHDFVPCVSCMSNVFDKTYEEENEVSFIMHHREGMDIDDHYPVLTNDEKLDEVVSFIGKTKYLITNSYHALYWGILMRKRVIAIPVSSKMYGFKYPVPISSFKDFKQHMDKTVVYNEALDVCRYRNELFAKRVFNYLEI